MKPASTRSLRAFLVGILVAAAAVVTSSTAVRAQRHTDAEALVRQRMKDLVTAIHAKDIAAVVAFYAPSIVSFDIDPPLRYAGADHKRQAWQAAFAAYTGPINYETSELSVTTDGELAFVHSLNHISGTLANGHKSDMWLRWTGCWRRIDGIWLIVHDHASVPADLEHGQALVTLKP